MTLRRISQNLPLIKFIVNCKNPELLAILLKNLSPSFLLLLRELITNLLKNKNIDLTKNQHNNLLSRKALLRNIVKNKNSVKLSRDLQILSQKGGFGFLIPLISTLAPILFSLITKK
jgi:hypothetical protein